MENKFSYANALHFAELANLAYQEEKQFKKTASAMGYKSVKYFNIDGAQAYGMAKEDYIVLAFRGTEPTQFNDIKADLNALHVRNELGSGRVHKGFKHEVDDIWEQIEEWVAKRKFKQAYTCGHSLGGAMSTIACSRLPEGTTCYNYGSPRVGTPSWATEFNKKYTLHRFVNNNDLPVNNANIMVQDYSKIINCEINKETKDKVFIKSDCYSGHFIKYSSVNFNPQTAFLDSNKRYPFTKEYMNFDSDIPSDLIELIEILRKK